MSVLERCLSYRGVPYERDDCKIKELHWCQILVSRIRGDEKSLQAPIPFVFSSHHPPLGANSQAYGWSSYFIFDQALYVRKSLSCPHKWRSTKLLWIIFKDHWNKLMRRYGDKTYTVQRGIAIVVNVLLSETFLDLLCSLDCLSPYENWTRVGITNSGLSLTLKVAEKLAGYLADESSHICYVWLIFKLRVAGWLC